MTVYKTAQDFNLNQPILLKGGQATLLGSWRLFDREREKERIDGNI